ncbi:MAG: phosphate ABC transporter permease subunit PstC [Methanosarcinales archaeon]
MSRNLKEFLIECILFMSGITAVIVVALIMLFLFVEGIALFSRVNPIDFLFGKYWYPTSEPPIFGLLPLITGSLVVTTGAILFSAPLGVICAIYIAEIAPPTLKEIIKPIIEILAGIPSVVFGFFGLVILVPFIQNTFGLPTGQTALAGSIMLGIMALPTIISISEDAITAVPIYLKEGSLALGATQWQTIKNVIVPSAISGITAAVMLGIGRAIGETMTVMMVTGNAAVIPSGFLQSVRTMTATIALEMGEAPQGGDHYHALFAIGIALFITTFIINLIADYVQEKYKIT